jgi:hypothetical protein
LRPACRQVFLEHEQDDGLALWCEVGHILGDYGPVLGPRGRRDLSVVSTT